MFLPGWPALVFNPFYLARKNLARHLSDFTHHMTGRTLDIGCGTKPYERLCPSSVYIGLELDSEENRRSKNADVFYDGRRIPFEDKQFDSVITNQVLEHVFNPNELLNEIHRVLKYGGKLLVTVPFVWNEHEEPLDFARYSSFGLRFLLEIHGFKIMEFRKSGNSAEVLFQLINLFLNKKFKTPFGSVNFLLKTLFVLPVNLFGVLLGKIFPADNDLYLDNIVLAEKPQQANEAPVRCPPSRNGARG